MPVAPVVPVAPALPVAPVAPCCLTGGAAAGGTDAPPVSGAPALSLTGAAIATSISDGAAAVVLIALAVRTVGGLDWRRIVLGPAIAAGVASATMAALDQVPALAVAAGGTAYLAMLWVFERRVFPEDARVVRDFVLGRLAPGAA